MSSNKNLNNARSAKNDEFYTRYEDIETKIESLNPSIFEGKVIYSNCDAPHVSNFYWYFKNNFKRLKLKGFYCSGMSDNKDNPTAIKILAENPDEEIILDNPFLEDCFSPYSQNLFDEADMVITNPPFSRLIDFLLMLLREKKDFLIIGIFNTIISSKSIEALLKGDFIIAENTHYFNKISDKNKTEKFKFGNIFWLQTPIFKQLSGRKDSRKLKLFEEYNLPSYHNNPDFWERYDNYDGIDVKKLSEIPIDYTGLMGLPITCFLYDMSSFEILGNSCVPGVCLTKRYEGDFVALSYGKNTRKTRCASSVNDGASYILINESLGTVPRCYQSKKTGLAYKRCYKRIFVKWKNSCYNKSETEDDSVSQNL